MSLHRVNPRRDENEPQIRKRFAAHGWHTEQVSGKGMPDLLVWPSGTQGMGWRICLLVDVKMPKGKLEPAQEKKWAQLAEKGIPVYVVRTEADVDSLVRGEIEPWRPMGKAVAPMRQPRIKGSGVRLTTSRVEVLKREDAARRAASEAEETFAPGLCTPTKGCGHCIACLGGIPG